MKPPSVFIIASNADYAPAWRVHQHLSDGGVECFFCDEALLRVGEKGYQAKAERALEKASGLVVVAGSRERVESEWVRGIWRLYLEKKPAAGGTARPLATVRCDGMHEDELPRTLRRSGRSLTFPDELSTLHARLLHPDKIPRSARPAQPPAAAAPCTRRFLSTVTAVNVVILAAVIWLLVQHGGKLLTATATTESASAGQSEKNDTSLFSTTAGTRKNKSGTDPDTERPPPPLSGPNGSAIPGTGAAPDSGDPNAASILPEAREAAHSVTDTPAAGTPLQLNWRDAKLTFVFIPPGRFFMGSPPEEFRRGEDEPLHRVEITRGFWLARTECTRALWRTVMGTEPSYFSDRSDLPVESISWQDISGPGDSFLTRMNRYRLLPSGWAFALPAEAQWEYACRAGTTTPFSAGKTLTSIRANFDGFVPYDKNTAVGPYFARTVPVGHYAPNAWDLYDMHGNVAEYCADSYTISPSGGIDPLVIAGSSRVIRGGSWWKHAWHCRSASREGILETLTDDNTIGFRIAIVPAG